MEGEPTRVMIFPRFSSLVGPLTYTSAPLNARAFHRANLTMWRGSGIGVTSFHVTLEGSPDLRYWKAVNAWDPSADVETQSGDEIAWEWIRLSITIGGANSSVPLWVLAELLRRGQ